MWNKWFWHKMSLDIGNIERLRFVSRFWQNNINKMLCQYFMIYNRKIDIGPSMVAELKKWKLECPPNKLNLVFPNKAGGPIDHNNLLKRNYQPAIEKAKLGKFRFHDLRHKYHITMNQKTENLSVQGRVR